MTTIKLKNGSGAPLAGDLVQGEPALDLTNKRLYTEDSGGTVIEVGTNPTSLTTGTVTADSIGVGIDSPDTLMHLRSTSGAVLRLARQDGSVLANDTLGKIEFYTNDVTNTGVAGYIETQAEGGAAGGALILGTGTAGSSAERMRISAAGNVGIGTSSPSTKLHLGGTAPGDSIIRQDSTASGTNWEIGEREAGKWQIFEDDGDSIVATFTSSGNVGIGTNSPSKKLHVSGSGSAAQMMLESTDTSNGQLIIKNASTTNGFYVGLLGNTSGDALLYHGDAKNMTFWTNGSERMRIGASGNLLVGTTSSNFGVAGSQLGVGGNNYMTRSGANPLLLNRLTSDGAILSLAKDGTTVGSIGTESSGLIVGSGNVGIRFIDSGQDRIIPRTTALGNADGAIDLGDSGSRFNTLYLSGTARVNKVRVASSLSAASPEYTFQSDSSMGMFRLPGVLAFSTAGTERMRINSNGSLEISGNGANNEISQFLLNVGNPANDSYRPMSCHVASTAARSQILFYNPAGQVGYISTSGTSTSYNTSSDYRLKENVVPLTGATERVKQLNPSRFNFIADADTTVDGFLAHEVADVVPEAITGTKDGMRDEEYEVTPAVYEDVVIPAVLDEEGNEVEAERTEQQLVSEAVMGTRSVPDYQGIDQSKLVPLLVATIQELEARITALESN